MEYKSEPYILCTLDTYESVQQIPLNLIQFTLYNTKNNSGKPIITLKSIDISDFVIESVTSQASRYDYVLSKSGKCYRISALQVRSREEFILKLTLLDAIFDNNSNSYNELSDFVKYDYQKITRDNIELQNYNKKLMRRIEDLTTNYSVIADVIKNVKNVA